MFSSKPKKQPARLHKVDPTPKHVKLCQKLLPVIIGVLIILVLIFFVKLCFAIVPGPESNLYYYHMGEVV